MLSAPRSSTDDPLAHVFAPPPNESPYDKENRIRAEQEAKKRSDAIDEEINRQRIARRNSKPVKILLLGKPPVLLPSSRARSQIADGVARALGQSESGMCMHPPDVALL